MGDTMDMYITKYSRLLPTSTILSNDVKIDTFIAKREVNKDKTSLKKGDPVVLVERATNTGCGIVDKATIANMKTNSFLGFVVQVRGYHIAVLLRGKIVLDLDTSLFTAPAPAVGGFITAGDTATKVVVGFVTDEIQALTLNGFKEKKQFVVNVG